MASMLLNIGLLSNSAWTIFLCLFLGQCCEGQIHIVDNPQNVASNVANNVTMNCKFSASTIVVWSDPQLNTIVSGTNIAPGYDIQSNSEIGRYNLVIINATFGQQGPYRCQQFGTVGTPALADVVLLGGNPILSQNVTGSGALAGEVVRITCNVTYQGRSGPVMSWTRNGNTFTAAVNESSAGLAQYSVYVTTTPADNTANFSCNTFLVPGHYLSKIMQLTRLFIHQFSCGIR